LQISLGADERLPLVDHILAAHKHDGHEVALYLPEDGRTLPWPQVARLAAEDVAAGRSEAGLLLCWTGTGVTIAANKLPGVRAALCVDAETARGARLWNDANVLCLSMRLTAPPVADEILEAWFSTRYQPNPTDDACLTLVEELDRERQAAKD